MEEIERLFTEGVTAAGERAKGAVMVKDSKDNSGIVYHLRDALRTLGEYDATRKRHIESSGKDRIVRNYDEIRAFIQSSPSQKEFERIHIGIINPKTANLVMQKTKQDIDGYDVVLSNEFIAHIFRDHGDQRKETPRHQIAVTTANVEDLVEAMIDPDDVKAVEADTGPALRFEKSVGNKNVALTITSKKKGTLTLKSAWIIENSGGRTPSSNADALEETSETNGRSSAESSIPQPSDSVNSKFSISDENVSEETAEEPTEAAENPDVRGENADVSENSRLESLEAGYKKEASQLINVEHLDATSKNGSASTSANSITHPDDSVNSKFSISEENVSEEAENPDVRGENADENSRLESLEAGYKKEASQLINVEHCECQKSSHK